MTNENMTIAINAKPLLKSYKDGYGNFIYECFIRIAKQFPQHTFIFIFDKPFNTSFIFSSNIIPVIIGPSSKKLFLLKLWYHYKIPRILKKFKADLFITSEVCSLRTKVPQLLIIQDLAFLKDPLFVSKKYLKYYKENVSKFLIKAAVIVTQSNFCKSNIIENYEIDTAKIEVLYNGVDEILEPIDFEKREKIKEQFSKGNEYFLFCNDIYDEKSLFNILKAFSIFKKWQKSSMQLMIFSDPALKAEELQTLRLFKYKEDVQILKPQHELTQIISASYGLVDFSYYQSLGIHSLEAMKCNVPVITTTERAMPEICGEVALFVNPKEHKDVAEKMMMIFKDEKLRKDLIDKGREQVKKYSWQKTAELFWQSILKATH